jgi:hypothetical protein
VGLVAFDLPDLLLLTNTNTNTNTNHQPPATNMTLTENTYPTHLSTDWIIQPWTGYLQGSDILSRIEELETEAEGLEEAVTDFDPDDYDPAELAAAVAARDAWTAGLAVLETAAAEVHRTTSEYWTIYHRHRGDLPAVAEAEAAVTRARGTQQGLIGRYPQQAELLALRDLVKEAGDDLRHATLILDGFPFRDHAEELARDTAEGPWDVWPWTCIDWYRAAEELQHDYSVLDFMGAKYWWCP